MKLLLLTLGVVVLISCKNRSSESSISNNGTDSLPASSNVDDLDVENRTFDSVPSAAIDIPILIVTHAVNRWDSLHNAKKGIDFEINQFQQDNQNGYIVFLSEPDYVQIGIDKYQDLRTKSWYTDLKKPNLNLVSMGGEHDLKISYNKVILVGGNFGLCQTTTMFDVIRGYQGSTPLEIQMPAAAIFSGQGGRAYTLLEQYGDVKVGEGVFRELQSFEKTSWRKLDIQASVYWRDNYIGQISKGKKRVSIKIR